MKMGNKVRAVAGKGNSVFGILINQMQLITILLNKIAWSPELPQWLVDMLSIFGR